MLLAIIFAVGLVVASVLVHYEALRMTSDLIPRLMIRPQQRILVVLGAIMLVHVCVIGLFAISYYVMTLIGVGTMHGEFRGEPLDYFYYSATTYTTLGIGDVYAQGHMRIVAGIESLTGLVMISWSASFTYLQMERFWELHRK
jgi:hypothetical protein